MSPPQYTALLAAVLLALLIGFQFALAAGLPLGRAAWGGQHRVLPPSLRRRSLAAAAILLVAAWIVLARAGLAPPGAEPLVVRVAAWVFVAFLCLNTLANAVSKSPVERFVMTPAALLLAVCFAVVALS